jgi:hypothetical protein
MFSKEYLFSPASRDERFKLAAWDSRRQHQTVSAHLGSSSSALKSSSP